MIKITGGYLKGQYLKSDIKEVRPTSELVRLSIFNILEKKVEEAIVLDLYAGSGALGIEALSRGAEKSVFVDKSLKAIAIIKQNLVKTGLAGKSVVKKLNLPEGIGQIHELSPFDIIFLDPPYEKLLVLKTLTQISTLNLLAEKGLVVTEHSIREDTPNNIYNLIMVKSYNYGDTIVTIYSRG
ncbi:MAG: Ribosomal RNA small subunit methyltransferase D [candidate division WS2 bacterium]|uniref:Ribosomal RNA small subunit methyltransferase D n=1 Tax=Psychracetigena formicireducens TaxID=2986056 RepID=A0A9E2BGA6_PSYF1|nr:Ribosomal RNA small subunit methyltransferase D [Candidatus Psychracetigena formicireducens]MBT9144469.1 Ribosomal RNA small subunit methyltransferase D [Candidatus Psychracetigena formicireducens]